jgi:hypothetical protein
MKRLLLILFILHGCGDQKKDQGPHTTQGEAHQQLNKACLAVNVSVSLSDTVILLDSKTSIDSFHYVACGDPLLNNRGLLDSIRSLQPVKRISHGPEGFLNLVYLKTFAITDRQIDFELYTVINYKDKKRVMRPYLFRYIKPTRAFYITENPYNDFVFLTMEQWMYNDSLMSHAGCGD